MDPNQLFDEEAARRLRQLSEFLDGEVDGFDAQYGVETELRIDRLNYGAVRVSAFEEMMQALPSDCARGTFVDIGSGKGRALLLAARASFRRIIGVERDRSCCDTAKANVSLAKEKIPGVDAIEIECTGAYKWVSQSWPKDEDVFVFMYSPFFIDNAYRQFFDMLRKSARANATKVVLGFVNPSEKDEVTLTGLDFVKVGENATAYEYPASAVYTWKLFRLT